jgi:hypothetical protein
VAQFVERLLTMASLEVRIQTSLKYQQMGDMAKEQQLANTLLPAKKNNKTFYPTDNFA